MDAPGLMTAMTLDDDGPVGVDHAWVEEKQQTLCGAMVDTLEPRSFMTLEPFRVRCPECVEASTTAHTT